MTAPNPNLDPKPTPLPVKQRVPLPTFEPYKDSIRIWEMVLIGAGVFVIVWAIFGR